MKQVSLKKQYKDSHPKYKEFCKYFDRECRYLFDGRVPYYELSYRIKTWDSIEQKIERHQSERYQYLPQTLDEIHDIIGFRVITLFKRDVDVICEIINQNFNVLQYDDKSKSKADDVFGYLSVHYDITLSEHWLGSPSAERFKDIIAEIQVRTFSQHVWAASSHLLQYKREVNVPALMRRNMYRLAAVLEIVDNELESILDFRDDYQNRLREASVDENCSSYTDQQLDSSILEVVLSKHFPTQNKRNNEPYGLMLKELSDADITTCGQLEQLLVAQERYINKKEKERIKEHNHPFYSYLGLLRIALSKDKLSHKLQ